jgi:hypothetical protein
VTASAVSPDPSLSRSRSGLVVTGLMPVIQPTEKTQPETSGRLKRKVVVHQENVQLVFGVFVFGIGIFDIFSQSFRLWYIFGSSLSLEMHLCL